MMINVRRHLIPKTEPTTSLATDRSGIWLWNTAHDNGYFHSLGPVGELMVSPFVGVRNQVYEVDGIP